MSIAAATREKQPPLGGHAPVSNEPDGRDFRIERAVTSPPSPGKDGRARAPRESGVEDLPGLKMRPPQRELAGEETAPVTSSLVDIGAASYPRASAKLRVLETVHGDDDRVQVTNTGVYPWSAHASLLITAADDSSWIGTGWFIGPNTLVTAGHVVYIKNSGVEGRDGWVKRIEVMPGRNGTALPFGRIISTRFRTVQQWVDSGDENYDYGAIILPSRVGEKTGWLGFGVYSDEDLGAAVGNITGYPGDKPSGTQWYDTRAISSVTASKVHYDIDTAGGQSGSAAYLVRDGGRYAFGIHAYGGNTTNSATRIVSSVYQNLQTWKSETP